MMNVNSDKLVALIEEQVRRLVAEYTDAKVDEVNERTIDNIDRVLTKHEQALIEAMLAIEFISKLGARLEDQIRDLSIQMSDHLGE